MVRPLCLFPLTLFEIVDDFSVEGKNKQGIVLLPTFPLVLSLPGYCSHKKGKIAFRSSKQKLSSVANEWRRRSSPCPCSKSISSPITSKKKLFIEKGEGGYRGRGSLVILVHGNGLQFPRVQFMPLFCSCVVLWCLGWK